MKSKGIEEKGFMRLIVLAATGISLIVPFGKEAGEDIWLSILIGGAFSLLLYIMYCRIMSLFPGKDLFQILEEVAGKALSNVIILVYLFPALIIGASVLKAYGDFVTTTSIEETPIIIPIIFIAILCIYICKTSFKSTLCRWSYLFFLFNAPLPSIVILLLIPQMDLYNVLPVLEQGIKPVLMSALPFYSIGFTEAAFFTLFFFRGKTKKSPFKVYLTALFWIVLLILGVSMATMLVLGPDIYEVTLFPTHNVVTKIRASELLQRLEPIIIVSTVTAGFVKVAVTIFYFSKALSKLFNVSNYKIFVTPVSIVFICAAYIIYETTLDMWEFGFFSYQYFISFYLAAIPFGIWLASERHKRKQKDIKNTNGA